VGNGTGLGSVPRLTLENLIKTAQGLPPEIEEDAPRCFVLGLGIVKHFLGLPWIEEHISPEVSRPGFMRAEFSTSVHAHLRFWRISDLGELLFNLQHVPGFDERIEEMKSESPESYMCELHVARMLFINDWQFRFVNKSGTRSKDYDFEIEMPDLEKPICVEAKCKIESTPISADTVFTTLSSSRTQLPADKPGVFFVKVPQDWMAHPTFPEQMAEATTRFFNTGTGRVVSVVIYIEPVTFGDGGISHGHYFSEGLNPKRRFGPDRDWRLLAKWRPPEDHWNKLPPHWKRLIFVKREGYIAS
jgi:hypothetical protein